MGKNKKIFGIEKIKGMNNIAKNIFAPIYPIIAENILKETGISHGICIDIGTGPASLSIALGKISNLIFILLDSSEQMLNFAKDNIKEAGIKNRCILICGDVNKIPAGKNCIDLIISRGSVFFWDDLNTAFKEIYRVLSPGGMTYIGGGFGNKEFLELISSKKILEDPKWKNFRDKNLGPENKSRIISAIENANVYRYRMIDNDTGLWAVIEKN